MNVREPEIRRRVPQRGHKRGAVPNKPAGLNAGWSDESDWRHALAFDPPEVRLDGRIPARAGLAGCVPDEAGIYLFHDLRGVLYVGRTGHLRRRFIQHLEGSHNSWLTGALRRPVGELGFGWFLADAGEQDDLERNLIRTFRPLCNHLLYRT